jgi:hypothetical protein
VVVDVISAKVFAPVINILPVPPWLSVPYVKPLPENVFAVFVLFAEPVRLIVDVLELIVMFVPLMFHGVVPDNVHVPVPRFMVLEVDPELVTPVRLRLKPFASKVPLVIVNVPVVNELPSV